MEIAYAGQIQHSLLMLSHAGNLPCNPSPCSSASLQVPEPAGLAHRWPRPPAHTHLILGHSSHRRDLSPLGDPAQKRHRRRFSGADHSLLPPWHDRGLWPAERHPQVTRFSKISASGSLSFVFQRPCCGQRVVSP